MKVKLIGLGKCGTRMTYDFFAYVSSTPTAYEIKRLDQARIWSGLKQKFPKLEKFDASLFRSLTEIRTWLQDVFGEFLICDPAEFVVVDSDLSNNEIMGWIAYLNDQGRKVIFPGKQFAFADRVGGCDFGIISENVSTVWQDMDKDITAHNGADFVATAFSVGGGTGSGSAPQIAKRCKQLALEQLNAPGQIHFMGLGVLPISDEAYGDHPAPEMSSTEKYNSGRFFTRLYGQMAFQPRRPSDEGLFMDSVWLFSNDALESALQTQDNKEPNISSLNLYAAAALTTLSNASSQCTRSQPDFDPSEMNNKLNGNPFMCGYAAVTPEKGGDRVLNADNVRECFKLALSNMTAHPNDHSLRGLSVPVRESELAEVKRVMGTQGLNSDKDVANLRAQLKTFDLKKAPLEFQTASHAILLYGQPRETHSEYKERLAHSLMSTFFARSNLESYYFKHSGTSDIALILIVNPFIRFAQKSLYYYVAVSWLNGEVDDGFFDSIIRAKKFDSAALDRVLLTEESLDRLESPPLMDDMAQFANPIRLERTHVINAFERLHSIYYYKKIKQPPSTI